MKVYGYKIDKLGLMEIENYLKHKYYMTESCYEKVFQTEPEYNMY